MRALDTNVLVRLLTRDDIKQQALAEAFIQGGAWISHLVLLETLWVLDSVYSLGPKKIATAVGMLLDHQNLAVQEPNTVAAALTQFRARPALGFADCLILEVARKAGHIPVATFDREFGKLDGTQKL